MLYVTALHPPPVRLVRASFLAQNNHRLGTKMGQNIEMIFRSCNETQQAAMSMLLHLLRLIPPLTEKVASEGNNHLHKLQTNQSHQKTKNVLKGRLQVHV
eukprot:5340049-Amphidinium_carterae.1